MKRLLALLILSSLVFVFAGCDDDGSTSGTCTPTQELCDGLDNDCDGVIDNGFECNIGQTQDCGSDVGECSLGSQTCTAQCAWPTECTGGTEAAQEECDGFDNDCDGTVDEDLTQVCSSDCGSGSEICVNGTWSNCTAVEPATEVCDGVDNDCDGSIDNGTGMECPMGTNRSCGSDVGQCVSGTELCDSTCNWAGTCLGETAAVTEACDGSLDENCDGQVDEDCACANGATQDCCGGTTVTCAGGTMPACPATPEEICNGTDDNCDDIIDNGLHSLAEGSNTNDTCLTATLESEMQEYTDTYYMELTGNLYNADLSTDVDYYRFTVLESVDWLGCLGGGNECHEYRLQLTGPDGTALDYEFDVIMTNIYDHDDRTGMCTTADSAYTFSSDGGYVAIKIAGSCDEDMDWEFFVKVYADGVDCQDYTLAIEALDAYPQDEACDSSYLPYTWW
jgi:Putative metal-binding motif